MANTRILEVIRRVWGNESFSADIAYLCELAARVQKCRSPILECGFLLGFRSSRRISSMVHFVERVCLEPAIRQQIVKFVTGDGNTFDTLSEGLAVAVLREPSEDGK